MAFIYRMVHMKKIKNLFLILLTLALLLNFAGCKKEGEGGETDTTPPMIPDLSFSDYAVIRPEKCSKALIDESSILYSRICSVSGQSNKFETDWLKDGAESDPNAKEILIGHTNRPESQQIISQLNGNEYAVAVVGNKIVIVGATDSITPSAVRYFTETYLNEGSAGVVPENLFYKTAVDVAVLVDKGVAVYSLVRSYNADALYTDLMYEISDVISDISGVVMPVSTDRLNSGETHDPEAFEILIGDTNYEETKTVQATVDPDAYSIQFIGNKIVIYAWSENGMQEVVKAFADMLEFACSIDADGKATVSVVKETILEIGNSAFYKDIPYEVNGNNFDKVYDAYNDTMMLYWSDVEENFMTDYEAALVGRGYTKYQSMDNDTSLRAATYVKDAASVHVYYLRNLSEFRVITQNNATLPVNPYSYEKVCDVAVTQLGLDYSQQYNDGPTGGMGYLIRLEDGSFIVIDGGDNFGTNGENLYNLMMAQKPASVENIVISAWILTHEHGDHYGLLKYFMAKHSDTVTLKMFIANEVPDNVYKSVSDNDRSRMFKYHTITSKFEECAIMKAHTGQQFFFPGFTVTVYYTHEDVYPQNLNLFNSWASVMFDGVVADENNTRIFWIGDCESEGAKLLKNMYYSDLKCDILQIGHHGSKGGSLELYQLFAPSIAFWPAGERVIKDRLSLEQNAWLVKTCDEIFYSRDGNATVYFGESSTSDLDSITPTPDNDGHYSKLY